MTAVQGLQASAERTMFIATAGTFTLLYGSELIAGIWHLRVLQLEVELALAVEAVTRTIWARTTPVRYRRKRNLRFRVKLMNGGIHQDNDPSQR